MDDIAAIKTLFLLTKTLATHSTSLHAPTKATNLKKENRYVFFALFFFTQV